MNEDLARICSLIKERQPGPLRQHVLSLLQGIASGTSSFRAVYHPVGFIYVPLLRADDWTLRLHLWITDGIANNSPYHTHTWDLTSYVMLGDLENQLIHATPRTNDPTLRVYQVIGQGDVDVFQRTDKVVRPEIESSERVFEGETYHMVSGIYHTTLNPTGGDLVTVALAERVPGTKELALGPLDGVPDQSVRLRCSDEDLMSQVAHVLARLS